MNAEITSVNREKTARVLSGWVMLPVVLLLIFGGPTVFIYSIAAGVNAIGHPFWWRFALGILMELTGIIFSVGLFSLQPNEARVLILFGEYKETVRASGFWWGNPFYSNGNRLSQFSVQMAQMEGKLAAAQGGRQAGGRGGSAKPPARDKKAPRGRP